MPKLQTTINNKQYFIEKCELGFHIVDYLDEATLFTEEEAEFLCKMFSNYESVEEKKYAINSNGYTLCVEDMYDLSFRFYGNSDNQTNRLLFFSEDEGVVFLSCLKRIFPTIPSDAKVVEV